MFKTRILRDLKKVVEELGYKSNDIVLSIPKNSDFGDYTSNIALQLAKLKVVDDKQSFAASDSKKRYAAKQNPLRIAREISRKLETLDYLENVEVAGSGFLNFYIKPQQLMINLHQVCDYACFIDPKPKLENDKGQKIIIEFAHPNTHKSFHIGHLRNITLGESLARLLEANGNEVFRANYQGDIGLHVAKALWGVKKLGEKNLNVSVLSKAYTTGAKAYQEDEESVKEIRDINKALYEKDSKLVPLWEKTRQISLDYFDLIYQKLGTRFDRLFFESEVEKEGKRVVLDHLGRVFLKDEGAVIFKGEDYGLHNRVFITSAGNPTYEAKDIGLAYLEKGVFPFDLALHVVGTDQTGYFQVMLRALCAIDDWFVGKEKHLSYGMVNLSSGKMSSRTGDVVTFDWLLEEVKKKVSNIMAKSSKEIEEEEKQQVVDIVSIGAIKFTMLKFAPDTIITFDLEKSVSLEGDSGPYVQYTYARAKSVLRNAQYSYQPTEIKGSLEKEEWLLLRQIEHFDSIVTEAAINFAPHLAANFLVEFSRNFNLFYQKHPIVKHEKSELRLALTCAVAVRIKQGLYLLGIEAPERM